MIKLGWLIAIPLSWMILIWWLDNFAYQIVLSRKYFAIKGLSTSVISILGVSTQAEKPAFMNLVKSLRRE